VPVDTFFVDVDRHLYTCTWEPAGVKLRQGGIAIYYKVPPSAMRVLQLAREAGWAATTASADPGLLPVTKPEK